MENVNNLKCIDEKVVNEETVETLESLLAQAKSGELQQIMLVGMMCDNVSTTFISGNLEIKYACIGVRR